MHIIVMIEVNINYSFLLSTSTSKFQPNLLVLDEQLTDNIVTFILIAFMQTLLKQN